MHVLYGQDSQELIWNMDNVPGNLEFSSLTDRWYQGSKGGSRFFLDEFDSDQELVYVKDPPSISVIHTECVRPKKRLKRNFCNNTLSQTMAVHWLVKAEVYFSNTRIASLFILVADVYILRNLLVLYWFRFVQEDVIMCFCSCGWSWDDSHQRQLFYVPKCVCVCFCFK